MAVKLKKFLLYYIFGAVVFFGIITLLNKRTVIKDKRPLLKQSVTNIVLPIKNSERNKPSKNPTVESKPKIILLGNDLYGSNNWGFVLNSIQPFEEKKCKITNCMFTSNPKDIKVADAVLFHKIRGRFPTMRLPHQRWIYLDHEPPYGGFPRAYAHLFNWTQTYRYDADMYMPYEYICKREKPISIDFKTLMKGKTKKIAWFVGNCHPPSKRELYVKEFMKYIDVDVYGGCTTDFGQKNYCGRTGRGNRLGHDCYQMIEKQYKFYLSFESCFDSGYITEKFYNLLRYNIVPIVRGDGNYTRSAIPSSYINTKDFKSPKLLAEYLLRLDKNDDEYLSYLKNRELYTLQSEGIPCKESLEEDVWCILCRKINDVNEPVKSIASLKEWWGSCRQPTDLTF